MNQPDAGSNTRKLWELADKNPNVHAVLMNWRMGYYASFEDAMISLVVMLAGQCERQTEVIHKLMTEAKTTLIMKETAK